MMLSEISLAQRMSIGSSRVSAAQSSAMNRSATYGLKASRSPVRLAYPSTSSAP